MLRSRSLDTEPRTCTYQALLKQTDVVAGRELMRAQVDDGIGDNLARAVECRLPASHSFDKVGAAITAQVCLLLRGNSADFSSPAGIDGLKFCGDDMWWWARSVEGRFRGEEAGDERFLQAGGDCVGDGAREVDVKELLPHRACHCCHALHVWWMSRWVVTWGGGGNRRYPCELDSIDKDFVTLTRRDYAFLRPPTPQHRFLGSLLFEKYGGQEEVSEWSGQASSLASETA